MKLVWLMSAGSLLSASVFTGLLGSEFTLALWLGMAAPLAAAVISWMSIHSQHARRPEAVTPLLIKSFVIKMLFFGVYVVAMIGGGLVPPVPFAVSFTGFFLALHITEAFGLHYLQKSVQPASAGPLGV
jgi:hypothetical protein